MKKRMYLLFIIVILIFISITFISAFNIKEWFNDLFKLTGSQIENTTSNESSTTTEILCSDTDGGTNLTGLGTVVGLNSNNVPITVIDFCVDAGINEYFCSGNYVASNIYSCPSGTNCSAGICRQLNPGEVSSPNIGYTPTSPSTPCTDTDNGLNVYIKGVGTGTYAGAVIGYNAIYGQEPNPNIPIQTSNSYSTYYDYCSPISPNQLNEAYCDSKGLLSSYGSNCGSYGCKDGACISPPTTFTTSPSGSGGGSGSGGSGGGGGGGGGGSSSGSGGGSGSGGSGS